MWFMPASLRSAWHLGHARCSSDGWLLASDRTWRFWWLQSRAEQQGLANAWVTSSITNISASSGCAIEAAPTPQPIITLPPAIARLVGAAANPGVTVTPVQPNAAAETVAPAPAVLAGGEGAANASSDARKRSPKARSLAGGGAASSTAAAIMSAPLAALRPARRACRLEMVRHRDAGGLSDDDGDTRRDDEPVDDGAETATAHGTAMMMQCLYTKLYGNSAPSKEQMMDGRERAVPGTC